MLATQTINVAKRDKVPSTALFRETVLDIFQELGAKQLDAVTLLSRLGRDFDGLPVSTLASLISRAGIQPQSGTMEGKPGQVYSKEQFVRLPRSWASGSSQIEPPRLARPRVKIPQKFAIQEHIRPPKAATLLPDDSIPVPAGAQKNRRDDSPESDAILIEEPPTPAAAEPVPFPTVEVSRPIDSIPEDAQSCRQNDSARALTGRQREVLDGILNNLADSRISEMIGISKRGVKFHVSNLLTMFGVRRRGDLIILHADRVAALALRNAQWRTALLSNSGAESQQGPGYSDLAAAREKGKAETATRDKNAFGAADCGESSREELGQFRQRPVFTAHTPDNLLINIPSPFVGRITIIVGGQPAGFWTGGAAAKS